MSFIKIHFLLLIVISYDVGLSALQSPRKDPFIEECENHYKSVWESIPDSLFEGANSYSWSFSACTTPFKIEFTLKVESQKEDGTKIRITYDKHTNLHLLTVNLPNQPESNLDSLTLDQLKQTLLDIKFEKSLN